MVSLQAFSKKELKNRYWWAEGSSKAEVLPKREDELLVRKEAKTPLKMKKQLSKANIQQMLTRSRTRKANQEIPNKAEATALWWGLDGPSA